MTTTFLDGLAFRDNVYMYRGGFYDYHQKTAEADGIKLRVEEYDEKALVWRDIFFQHLPPKEWLPKAKGEVRALELGCNTGYNTKAYEKIYGRAVGIDPNPMLVDTSKVNHPECYLMRAEYLDFQDNTFSVVLAKDVLEHCQYPDKAIDEAYRVLEDGGYIVAMIPLDAEEVGIDDVAVHDAFNYNNPSHTWKATAKGVVLRFFRAGFTDIETHGYSHTQLFGEKREYGDFVMVIRARKQEGVVKVPDKWLWGSHYWAAFLTFMCTGNCEYCIQHLSREEFVRARTQYNRDMLMPQDWINFYQSLQKWKKQKLGIIGGEPTVYPGFFDVLNGLDDYYRTITTNLTTPAFNNIAEFVDKIRNHSNLRINTSFHPEITTVDDFANKIHQLRDAGMHVDQISMVAHPGSMYRKYSLEFLRRGIHLAPQTYLGKWNEELLPSPLSDAPDFGEHEIDDRILYEEGFSNRNRHEVLCSSGRFMVAPNGDIHKCHYLLYSGKNPLGNIKDLELPRFNDYDLCGEYGFCNPCDYPHVKFKPVQLELKTELDKLLTDESLSTALWEWFLDHTTPEFQGIIAEVSGILYCSDDPYWTLYNDERLKQVVNDYCEEPGVWDNARERMFAQMDGSLFRFLPAGVNLYRILNEIPMLKYIDALGHVIRHVLAFHHPSTKRVFEREETAIGLDTLIANIMATVGCSHMNDGSISIWRTCEDGEKEKEEV